MSDITADEHPLRLRAFEVAQIEGEPIEFELGGRQLHAIPELPLGLLAEFGSRPQRTQWQVQFLQKVVVEEDEAALRELLYSKTVTIPAETLVELVTWLVEEYVGRPTTPSEPSGPGRSPNGDGSTDSLPSAASTPEGSTSAAS